MKGCRERGVAPHCAQIEGRQVEGLDARTTSKGGYKASLIEERQDMNPEVIKASLAKPGEMIMVDDPRAVLSAIGRKPGTLSTSPYAPIPKVPTKAGPMAKLDHKELSTILAKDDGWQVVPKTEEEKKSKGEQILARAEAAEELRRRGVRLLEDFTRTRAVL